MKIKLLILALSVFLLTSACKKKAGKTRMAPYTCYAWHLYAGDTILTSTTKFDYPLYPIQDQEDSLNAYFQVPGYWYTCSY